MKPFTLAIDGPAGAGKSTLAKAAAEALGLIYLDTGAMYRACGLACKRAGVDIADKAAAAETVGRSRIDIRFAGGEQHVFLDGDDVSREIRLPEISVLASDVSAIPEVRRLMVDKQREIASKRDIVVDGRDIGTYVLPDADCKIFLTAKPEVRAERRYKELLEKGEEADFEAVLADINYRDRQDSTRAFAPLKQADDAILLDTSEMDQKQVLEKVLELASERKKS